MPSGRCGALIAALVAAAGCSSDEEDPAITAPDPAVGVSYFAIATDGEFDGVTNLLVTLRMTNTTIAPISLTYPAGCPVRIRLYDATTAMRVYDETQVDCAYTSPATITIPPNATRSIGSGFRSMARIAGDSLKFTSYRVIAVPQTEGDRVIEVPAGMILFRQ